MQMWNMVIGAPDGERAGAPASSIEATHGMPVGEFIPGMRGHMTSANLGLEQGEGPSYGPGAPYTITNTQSVVMAIVNNEYNDPSMPGAKLDTMAPPSSPKKYVNPQAGRAAKEGNGGAKVAVGKGQSQKVIHAQPLPGSHTSSGDKADAYIAMMMMASKNVPAKTEYEDYTQMALQQEPAYVNPQAHRANMSNSNKANGRKKAVTVNPMDMYLKPPGRQLPAIYMQGSVQSTKSASNDLGYAGGRA